MTIEEKLRERLKKAMKNSNAFEKSIIRVILSEFYYKNDGKPLDDELAKKVLTKIRKDLEETNTEQSKHEADFVSEYLPKIMTEEEIESGLMALILVNEGIEFKPLKVLFDQHYPGQNGAIVAKHIKELI